MGLQKTQRGESGSLRSLGRKYLRLLGEPLRIARRAVAESRGREPAGGEPHAGDPVIAWLVLAAALLATGLTWYTAKEQTVAHDRARFELEVARTQAALLDRVDRYSDTLRALGITFRTFGETQPDRWVDFIGQFNFGKLSPALGDIAFLEYLPGSKGGSGKPRFAPSGLGSDSRSPSEARSAGFPVRLTSLRRAGWRPLTSSVTSWEDVRRAAEQARDSAAMTIVPVLGRQAEEESSEQGLLAFSPIFRGDEAPRTVEQRRSSVRGWLGAFVRSKVLMKEVAAHVAQLDFQVFDGRDLKPAALLYDHRGSQALSGSEMRTRFRQMIPVEVGGRTWTLVFGSRPALGLAGYSTRSLQILLGGMAASVLLFGVVWNLETGRSRSRLRALVSGRRLRESEGLNKVLTDHSPGGIITFDRRGIVGRFSPGAERIFGYRAEEAVDYPIATFLPSCFENSSGDSILELNGDAGGSPRSFRSRQAGRRKDGTQFPIDLICAATGTDDRWMATAIVNDISESCRTEAALKQSQERYDLTARAANDGLWDWDLRKNEIQFSPRWKAILGFADDEIGNRPENWFDRVHLDDRSALQARVAKYLEGQSPHFEAEFRILHSDGSYRWVLNRGLAVRDEDGRAVRMVGAQTDITARKQAERRLLQAAFNDPLTGLANRTYFMDRLENATRKARQNDGELFALLFLDLDRFKVVNDSLGHPGGDQLLISVARRLKTCVRPSDTIARLGGDEFAILLESLRDEKEATRIADRIQLGLSQPFTIGDQEVFTAASIGIALSSDGHQKAEDLLRGADSAMYRAKALGKDRYEIFDRGMPNGDGELLHLETSLRRGLERKEFRIHYQPIVSLASGLIAGCEALLRWQHPERGLLRPSEFIPVAEETGVIIPISEWILRAVCQQAKDWQNQGFPPIRACVNVSPRQLREPNFFDVVSEVLVDTGLDPWLLQLELTENSLLDNADATIKPLVKLYTKGVKISLDDFGTGYSSMMHLRRFPISALKIDECFVREITTDAADAAIATGLILLAHSLELKVIGEGVETPEQMKFLQSRKCDEVQGHVISPPVEVEAFSELLRRREFLLARLEPSPTLFED